MYADKRKFCGKGAGNMKERILNIANILGAFIFLAITAAFYFLPNIYYGTGIKVLGLTVAVLIIFLVCTVSNNDKIKKAKNILNAVSVRRVYVITAAVLFTAQIVFVLCIRYTPVSDGKYLDIICRNAADGRDTYYSLDIYHTHYLERYSNQWGLFLLQTLLYKTVRAALGYVPKLTAPLAAVVCMQLSYFLMYKLSDKIFDSNPKKLLCMAAMFFHPILFVYSCIFYTDVLSMPFVLAAIYFGICAAEEAGKKRFLLFSVLTSIMVGVGFCVKGTVAIAGVALIIYLFFKVNLKRALCFTAAVVIGFAGIVFAERQIMYSADIVTCKGVERYGFPLSHWVMMGLTGRGGYDNDSFMFTYSQPDIHTRNKACREKISNTLNEMGVTSFAKHIFEKLNYTWSGGAYQLTWQFRDTPDSAAKRFFGGSIPFLCMAFTAQNILILLMTASFMFSAVYRRTDNSYIVRLTVYGLVLFLLLWETRSRYMINILPLFIVIAVDGLCLVQKAFIKQKSPAP